MKYNILLDEHKKQKKSFSCSSKKLQGEIMCENMKISRKKEKAAAAEEKRIKKEYLLGFFENPQTVETLSEAQANIYLKASDLSVFSDRVNRFCIDGDCLIHAENVGDYSYARRTQLTEEEIAFVREHY